MRAIVTGAAGFIGSTLVDRLLADGHSVVGIDNLASGRMANLAAALQSGRFTFIEVNVASPGLGDIVEGAAPQVVFHLAAQVDVRESVANPLADAHTNVLGTINIAEACRRAGSRRIVFAASGGSRYGTPSFLPVGEGVEANPLSPYAAAKVAGELYLGAYFGMYGLAPINLALANVYGPRQDPYGEAGVVAIFGSALLTGNPTTIYGDGCATRDYVYVDDVVDAFVRAAAAPMSVTGTFNIGTGVETATAELHRLMTEAVGTTDPPRYADPRTGEIPAISLDSSAARSALQWSPRVDMREGVRRTVCWLRETLDTGRTTASAITSAI